MIKILLIGQMIYFDELHRSNSTLNIDMPEAIEQKDDIYQWQKM